jgi:glycogen(starch) synthase
VQITPAFLPIEPPDIPAPPDIERWLAQHSPVICSAMFFRPEYGFELLVQAVGRLRKQHPRIGALIMGTGENREQARTFVERQGLQDAVYLTGDVDHELCLALMSRSQAFVRPTLRDGDSISVREAISLGVPVVASNIGTRPEGVRLFEVGDVDGLTRQLNDAFGSRGSGVRM